MVVPRTAVVAALQRGVEEVAARLVHLARGRAAVDAAVVPALLHRAALAAHIHDRCCLTHHALRLRTPLKVNRRLSASVQSTTDRTVTVTSWFLERNEDINICQITQQLL